MSDKISSSEYMPAGKSGFYCFISNDNDNIYIDMKVEDSKIQNRILTEGLTIWINMEGREEKKLGIRFPLGSQNNLLAMANTIEILGFINEQQRRFPAENPDNFRGSIKIDAAGTLFYKMVMPVVKLPVRNAKKGIGASPFSLGIEYGSGPETNNRVENRGPAPSYAHKKAKSAGSGLHWIKNIKLATSK
jgi:hypothetical protein